LLLSGDPRCDLSSLEEAELVQNLLDVPFCRPFGDEKALRDLAIRQTLSDKDRHLFFPSGKRYHAIVLVSSSLKLIRRCQVEGNSSFGRGVEQCHQLRKVVHGRWSLGSGCGAAQTRNQPTGLAGLRRAV
jgi:hypothetical protein